MTPQAMKRSGDPQGGIPQPSLAPQAAAQDVATPPGTPLGVLNALISITDATQDVDTLLGRALQMLLAALTAERAAVYLREGEQWILRNHLGLEAGALPAIQSLPDAAFSSWLRGPTPSKRVPLCDLAAMPGALGQAFTGCRGLFCLPLMVREQNVGLILVGTTSPLPSFWLDQEFLGALGKTIGLAVDHSRLYQRMEERLRASQALYEVGRALTSTLDLDALLNLIVRSAVDTIGKAKNGVLHLLDEETNELRPKALSFATPGLPDVAGRSRMKPGQGVAGIALQLGQVVNVPDVSKDERFIRVGQGRSFASMLVAPLLVGERRIGTLSIDSDEPFAFTPDDERLLMTLASQAATAIEQARLVKDLQQSLEELRTTQAQLIQSEKLSAIGQLIAGVAHELNNPLTAIMGYAQLLQLSDEVSEGVLRDLNKIYLQAQRAAKIVQNLLTFARQHKGERQLVNINEVLERTLELRAYQLRVDNVELSVNLAEEELLVLADPNQLQQVFLNLINNAQDAIAETRRRGHLVVSTQQVADKVQIRFSDDGPGLLPQVRQHLFEPFFTTKEVGKGTGLGLSICFGIVSQHGGRIWAEDTAGGGATFVVELPQAPEGAAAPTGAAEASPVAQVQGKVVLVVEDEEDVAQVVQRALAQDQHHVLWATDGETALQHLAQAHRQGAPFHLIISDIKMPGLGGPAFYERVRAQDPALAERIIFITGDTLSPSTRRFLESTKRPYLAKPFTIEDLRRAIAGLGG